MLPKIVLLCSLSCILAISLESVAQNDPSMVASNGSSCINQTIELLMNDDDIKRLQAMLKTKKYSDKKTKAHLCIHSQPSDCPHKHHQLISEDAATEHTTKAMEMTLAQLTSDIDALMSAKSQEHLEVEDSSSLDSLEIESDQEIRSKDTVKK